MDHAGPDDSKVHFVALPNVLQNMHRFLMYFRADFQGLSSDDLSFLVTWWIKL
jgi:hypothetical protein